MTSHTKEQRVRKFLDTIEKGTVIYAVNISKVVNLTPRSVANIIKRYDDIKQKNPRAKDGVWIKL